MGQRKKQRNDGAYRETPRAPRGPNVTPLPCGTALIRRVAGWAGTVSEVIKIPNIEGISLWFYVCTYFWPASVHPELNFRFRHAELRVRWRICFSNDQADANYDATEEALCGYFSCDQCAPSNRELPTIFSCFAILLCRLYA